MIEKRRKHRANMHKPRKPRDIQPMANRNDKVAHRLVIKAEYSCIVAHIALKANSANS